MEKSESLKPFLLEVLDTSGISIEDKQLWLGMLESQSEEVQLLFLKIFYRHEGMLEDITENLKLKLRANNGEASLQDIWEREFDMFSSLPQESSV